MAMSEPEERVDDRAGCIVACVDVHFASLALGLPDDEPASILLGFLLPRIEHAIRSDDRICPFSVSRLAVQFGSLADEVLPQVLGDRLAQAIVHQAAGDAVPPGMTVSVGVATPFEGGDGRDITRLALAAARSGPMSTAQLSPSTGRSTRMGPTEALAATRPSIGGAATGPKRDANTAHRQRTRHGRAVSAWSKVHERTTGSI